MAEIPVLCPSCKCDHVVKRGKTELGKQRYLCLNPECGKNTFILDYTYHGYLPGVKEQIIDMAMNGSGIRDTARVLRISSGTVISEIKKQEPYLESVNQPLLKRLKENDVVVDIQKVDDTELDEMWSYVGNKENQRWLWHAIDHATGDVLAYVFGKRKDTVFLSLQELLKPFWISRFYTDDWGAYERNLPNEQQIIGKENTQKIERKHLTLRTRIKRLARKTICFSKIEKMHDIVIGLFINRHDFGRLI